MSLKKSKKFISKAKPRVFKTGAQRDNNDNKPYIHNLKGYTRIRFGFHMTTGAKKYGDGNWEKGMPLEQYIQSLDRHLAMYMNGDRSEDHLSAIIFNCQGAMIEEQKLGITPNYYFLKNNGRRNKSNKGK